MTEKPESAKSYTRMLKAELLEVARRLGLTNLGLLRKREIIDLIRKATARRGRAVPSQRQGEHVSGKMEQGRDREPARSRDEAEPATGLTGKSKAASEGDQPGSGPPGAGVPVPEPRTGDPEPPGEAAAAEEPTLKREQTAGRAGSAPEAEADLLAQQALRSVDENLPDLVEGTGENRIVALVVDPSWLFTYWDLSQEYKDAAIQVGGKIMALRLYDVTGRQFDGTNAHSMSEFQCSEWARSWYLPVSAPNREYLVEIGYIGDTDWFPLCRSNPVQVPPDQPSAETQGDLATIPFDQSLQQAAMSLPQVPEEMGPLPTGQVMAGRILLEEGDLRIVVGGARLSPSGMPGGPALSGELILWSGQVPSVSMAVPPGSLGQVPGSLGQVPGSLGQVPGSLGQVPGSLGQVPGSPGAPVRVPGSLGQLTGSIALPTTTLTLSKDQEPPGLPEMDAGVVVMLPVGQADRPGGADPASPAPARPALEAHVELVLSGRASPGSRLTVAGHAIPVGPDGCFSLRIQVPEGMREIPIEAEGGGHESRRRIRLRFGRDTEQG